MSGSDRAQATRETQRVGGGVGERGERQAARVHAILAQVSRALAHRQHLDGYSGGEQPRDERAVLGEDDMRIDIGKRVDQSRQRDLAAGELRDVADVGDAELCRRAARSFEQRRRRSRGAAWRDPFRAASPIGAWRSGSGGCPSTAAPRRRASASGSFGSHQQRFVELDAARPVVRERAPRSTASRMSPPRGRSGFGRRPASTERPARLPHGTARRDRSRAGRGAPRPTPTDRSRRRSSSSASAFLS